MIKNVSGAKYFGLQHSFQCMCGNEDPSPTLLTDTAECNMKCNGGDSGFCGGVWRMNIFNVAEYTGSTGMSSDLTSIAMAVF